MSRGNQGFLHFGRQVEKNKVADVVEIVFAAFVNHANQVILLCLWVRDDFVQLPRNQGGFVSSIINTKSEMFFCSHRLIQIPFGFDVFTANSMRFIPVKFNMANIPVGEFDVSKAFEFSPTSAALFLIAHLVLYTSLRCWTKCTMMVISSGSKV